MAGAVKMTKSVRPVVIKIAFNTMLMIEIIIVKALAQHFSFNNPRAITINKIPTPRIRMIPKAKGEGSSSVSTSSSSSNFGITDESS